MGRNQGFFLVEHRLLPSLTGAARWVESRGRVTRSPDGRPRWAPSSTSPCGSGRPASREKLLAEVEAAHNRLLSLFDNAPAFLALLRGPEHVYEVVDAPYQRHVGSERKLLGLPVAQALPELVPQGFVALLDGVYRTGTPHIGREMPVRFDRQGHGELEEAYVDFVYQPLRNAQGQVEGIVVFGLENTEQVRPDSAWRCCRRRSGRVRPAAPGDGRHPGPRVAGDGGRALRFRQQGL